MTRNAWANKALPPLLVIIVIACIWYALESRPDPQLTPSATSTPTISTRYDTRAVANATNAPDISPSVQKVGTDVHLSVPVAPLKHIQKVEFYIESQFVGAAYSQPFTVAVNENTLSAGSHTVVAKIFTDSTTTKSKPINFVAQPSKPVAPAIDTSDAEGAAVVSGATPSTPTTPPETPEVTPPLDTPQDLVATAGADGTSITLTWSATNGSSQYQIWRDNIKIATSTGVGYTDTNLNPGQTYDYQILAVGSAGQTSGLSNTIAITLPSDQNPTTLPTNPEAAVQSPAS